MCARVAAASRGDAGCYCSTSPDDHTSRSTQSSAGKSDEEASGARDAATAAADSGRQRRQDGHHREPDVSGVVRRRDASASPKERHEDASGEPLDAATAGLAASHTRHEPSSAQAAGTVATIEDEHSSAEPAGTEATVALTASLVNHLMHTYMTPPCGGGGCSSTCFNFVNTHSKHSLPSYFSC